MLIHRPAAPLVAVIALFALMVTGCTSSGDTFMDVLQAGGALVLCYCALMIGRAIAARIAGDNAEVVLGMPLISITLPALPRRRSDTVKTPVEDTDNTKTLDNTEIQQNTVENTAEMIALSSRGVQWKSPRMTKNEWEELLKVRHEAIGLLTRCVKYYQQSGNTDDGTIPRFDVLKMASDDRGFIVKNLEYSEVVSIVKNKRTFVVPDIGSCAMLLKMIEDNQKRIYPVGYAERKQALMDSAVMALPANERHD